LISKGLVYRFIHKPMSPGRARLFAEAAVKKYEETRKLTATVPSIARQSRSNRGLVIGAAIVALGLVIFWVIHKNTADDAVTPPAAAERPAPAGQAQQPVQPPPVTGLQERFDEAARNAAPPKAAAR